MAKILQGKLSGTTSDVRRSSLAVALVVAHEFGHSIHQELKAQGVPMARTLKSVDDVGTELFADCLAGNWASTAYPAGYLEAGDIEAALEVSAESGGAPGAGSRTAHGTAQERVAAIELGYTDGAPYECMHAYIGTP